MPKKGIGGAGIIDLQQGVNSLLPSITGRLYLRLHLKTQLLLMAGGGSMEPSNRAYDLFLSHRGPDKKDFCAFLREAVHRAGVRVFVDEFDLEVGALDAAWTPCRTRFKALAM